jgi:hypothetical protein
MTAWQRIRLAPGIFWRAWSLVNRVKRSDLPASAVVDDLIDRRRPRRGPGQGEIMALVDQMSRRFWFHRPQACLSRSLATYYYLRLFGHDPYLVIDLDLDNERYYNCHIWVADKDAIDRELARNPKGVHQVGDTRTYLRDEDSPAETGSHG